MLEEVLKWVDEQGFALEMRTAAAFKAAGFEVQQPIHYFDHESKKLREMDVHARYLDHSGILNVIFLVECKSSKKPWVLLSSADTLSGYNRLFSFAVTSERARRALSEHLPGMIETFDWLKKDGIKGYSLRQAFSDIDSAYAAAVGLAKASSAMASHPVSRNHQLTFVFPILVVDSPIVQCVLNPQGELESKPVEFLFEAETPNTFQTCIRVVSSGRLLTFAREAKRIAERLHEQFAREVEDAWESISRPSTAKAGET